MKFPSLLSSVPLMTLLLCWPNLGCGPPPESGAAHDVAEAESSVAELVATTLFGEGVLLFMEHPPLVRGEEARFLAHFSILDTGAPVCSGRVVLQVGDTRLVADAPARDGVFIPQGSLPEAGVFEGRLELVSDEGNETFDLGEVVVHATQADTLTVDADDHHEHDDAIRFLLEQQWKVGLLLARAVPQRVTRRLVIPADVVAAEGSSAVASAPLAGRLLAPDGGGLPRSGDSVTAGQVLARVEPPLSTAEGAQLRALQLEWELTALEVEQRLAEVEAQLQFTEADHARIAALRGDGLSTQQQLDQAERDLTLARGARTAAQAAQRALQEQRAQRGTLTGSSPEGSVAYPVQAPIAGVLVAAGHVVGEALEAHQPLFRIVDGSRVWIEGRVSEFELPLVRGAPEAQVTFPAVPGLRLSVGGAAGAVLSPEVDPGSRTAVLRYELPVTDGVVRPGMLAELEVAVETVEADVVIPQEAVLFEGGLPFAYVMYAGELFERRELALGLRDGGLVAVLSGVAVGERVATRGASTVRLAAMVPASFGHQHQH